MIHQRGFSFIEVLIALVVLSIGLIGVAAMQLKALHSANAGYQRSVVTLAAVDAQERLWAELVRDDAESCAGIDIEADWKAQWFAGSGSNPLSNVNEQESKIVKNGCKFTIEIGLDSLAGNTESDAFTYTLRLPALSGDSNGE